MSQYIATIRHHSIASARHIEVEGSLAQAKRAATREFGAEQRDYTIVVGQRHDDGQVEIVSSRRVGDRAWI